MLKIVDSGSGKEEWAGPQVGLDELCRLAAREMLAVALEAERREYLERYADLVDGAGQRLVVENGYAREREITPVVCLPERCRPT